MNTIKIDGRQIEIENGATILEAAKKANINIPTLCYMRLDDFKIENKPGGCRICVVEIKGRKNLVPACATKCTDGMEIFTSNIRVLNAGKPLWS